jgi:hypothetical protein
MPSRPRRGRQATEQSVSGGTVPNNRRVTVQEPVASDAGITIGGGLIAPATVHRTLIAPGTGVADSLREAIASLGPVIGRSALVTELETLGAATINGGFAMAVAATGNWTDPKGRGPMIP